MARKSSHWKRTERKTAKHFDTKRTPLSGENSGHGGGDVILRNVQQPDGSTVTWDCLVECKHYKKFAIHTLFRAAQADAKKHGITPGHTILVTKLKGERGELVTLDASTFYKEILPLWKPQLVKPKEAPSGEAAFTPDNPYPLDPGVVPVRVTAATSFENPRAPVAERNRGKTTVRTAGKRDRKLVQP